LVIVAVQRGEDKFQILEKALDDAGLWVDIEEKLLSSGMSREKFSVVVKPNMMMYSHKEDPPATYTDIELVEHLFDMLYGKGFRSLKLVESQNVYGNWYQNRGVVNVARVSGHRPDLYGYEVCDLTEDVVTYNFHGEYLKEDPIGIAWKDGDYRISFAKNKTHVYDYYTLNLKNIYGVTPEQDKMFHYHALKEWYGATFDILRCFPVHFGIIDAYWSADGFLGFKGTTNPKKTEIIVASKSIIAADMVGARMMGRDPRDSDLMTRCQDEWGTPSIEWVGNVDEEYIHKDWQNIDNFTKTEEYPAYLLDGWLNDLIYEEIPWFVGRIIQLISTILEENYVAMTIGGLVTGRMASDYMDRDAFPLKPIDEIIGRTLDHSLKNTGDLLTNSDRHRSIQMELGKIWRSIFTFLVERYLPKAVEKSKKKLEASREKLA